MKLITIIALTLLFSCGKKTEKDVIYKNVEVPTETDTRASCKVYELPNTTVKLPDFSTIPSIGTVKTERFDDYNLFEVDNFYYLEEDAFFLKTQSYFGLSCEGIYKVVQDGVYTISLLSDDGSKLSINDVALIANDGVHGNVKKSVTVSLKEGEFKVNLEYFQQRGMKSLVLSIRRQGSSLEEIMLF